MHRITDEGAAPYTDRLADAHRQALEEGSGIAREVLEERGYRSVARGEVPPEFKNYQCRAGLLIPLHSPDRATTGYQLRPNKPRRDKRGKPIKYETPAGARIIADVHPRMLETAGDASIPLWITEGVKCGDALTSRGRCTVSLIGVWMYRTPKSAELLPCFEHVALQGRRVFVVFDSDVMHKPEVALALERLVGDLEDRGARVLVVYLPDAPDGGKQGVDDYLAASGTVEHMEEIARPFTPSEAARERMDRDDRLRDGIAQLWRTWCTHDWHGIGGHTRRELLRAILEDAERRGEPVPGGIRVSAAQRPLAERIGSRQPTVAAGLRRLEHKDGLIQRDTAQGRPADVPAAYILLVRAEDSAYPYQEGETGHEQGGALHKREEGVRREYDPGDTPARALGEIKRLRWSYVARVWAENGYTYEYRARLGKIAGHLLEALVIAFQGRASVSELAEAIGHRRPWDLRRRQLAKLEAAEIVSLEGSAVTLAGDWPEKLGIARELGGEYEAEENARVRHEAARRAYRAYRERGETLTREELQEIRRENARTRREAAAPRRRRAREADRMRRPNYWNWRERDHLLRTGADGNISELRADPDPPPPVADPPERRPSAAVGGVHVHGPLCACEWCDEPPQPRYAQIRGTA